MPGMKPDRRKPGDVIRCKKCGRLIGTSSYDTHRFFCTERDRAEAFNIAGGFEHTIITLPRGDKP